MRRIVTIIIALAMVFPTLIPIVGGTSIQGQAVVLSGSGNRGPINDTESEPNDDFSSATNITGNVSIPGNITFGDPSDFYRVHLNNTTSPNRLNASLEFTSNDPAAIVYLAILDPFKFRLDQALCRGNSVNTSALALKEGFYFIEVFWDIQNQANAKITYTLNISLVDHTFTPDGNDHPDDSTVIFDGFQATETIDELEDAADFYTLRMNQTVDHVDVVLLQLSMDLAVDLAIEIYNSTFTFIRQVNDADSGGDELAYFVAPMTDDYYFRVWANTGVGSYNLTVMTGTGWVDGDNDPGNATLVQEDVSVTGTITDDYDPEDFYRIDLARGEEITVNLTVPGYNTFLAMPVLNIWLYNETNFVKNSTSSDADAKEIWYEAEEAGLFYIRISASDMSFGDYGMLVTVVSPPVVLPHNSTFTIEEDSEGIIDLSTLFQDPSDGGLVFNFSGNVSTSISINGTKAVITSLVLDWYGSEIVTFVATNDRAKTASTLMTVVFSPVNDAPVTHGGALEIETNEDELKELPVSVLATKFTDVDGDELALSFVPNSNITINMTNDTIEFMPVQDWSGVGILTFIASDPMGLNSSLQVNLTVHPVEDDPIGQDIGDIEMDEDERLTFNISAYFSDPDGGILIIDGYSEGDTNGERHVFVSMDGDMAVITLTNDWSGNEPLTFTAKDATNNTASASALVKVSAVNDPPVVSQTYLDIYSTEIWVEEDTTGSFDLSKLFIDVDGDALVFKGQSTGTNINAVVSGSNLVVTPVKDWYGVENVNLSAEDPKGEKVWTNLPVMVVNSNDGPSMTNGGVSPKSGNEDTEFKFSVVVTDIDGDEPIVMLIINGKERRMSKESTGDIKIGALFTYTTKLKGGKNPYSFKADDNQRSAMSKVTLDGGEIDIEEPADTSAYLFYAGLIIVILILVGLIFAAYSRAQRMKEFDDSWEDEDEEISDDEE